MRQLFIATLLVMSQTANAASLNQFPKPLVRDDKTPPTRDSDWEPIVKDLDDNNVDKGDISPDTPSSSSDSDSDDGTGKTDGYPQPDKYIPGPRPAPLPKPVDDNNNTKSGWWW